MSQHKTMKCQVKDCVNEAARTLRVRIPEGSVELNGDLLIMDVEANAEVCLDHWLLVAFPDHLRGRGYELAGKDGSYVTFEEWFTKAGPATPIAGGYYELMRVAWEAGRASGVTLAPLKENS